MNILINSGMKHRFPKKVESDVLPKALNLIPWGGEGVKVMGYIDGLSFLS